MSIESVLKDEELTLMSSKVVKGTKVYCVDTSQHNAYKLDYMIIIVPINSDLNMDTMYSYYTDITDLYYFYDLI